MGMANYNSNSTEEPGQYPAPSWTGFGLPVQNESSGAAGSSGTKEIDQGSSNEPGQYPARDTFTGVGLDGTGAPGTAGVPNEVVSGEAGPQGDSVTYSQPTLYKGMYDDQGMVQGYRQGVASDGISGASDWTQANDFSYGPGYNLPGIEGNTPIGGEGQFQPGAGRVHVGGFRNGQRG
jgi:hypothetical protein